MKFCLKRQEYIENIDPVMDFLDEVKTFIEDEINNNIFLKISGYEVKKNTNNLTLKVCRRNPFWDIALLVVYPEKKGYMLEIKITPQLYWYYILSGLAGFYGLMLFFSLSESRGILMGGFFLLFSTFAVNISIKFSLYNILLSSVKKATSQAFQNHRKI